MNNRTTDKNRKDAFVVLSPWGNLKVEYSEDGIYALKKTTAKSTESQKLPALALQCKKELIAYFKAQSGQSFRELRMDFSGYTDFQKRVLMTLSGVEYGKVLTYEALAKKSGTPKGARAIGHVMSLNRTPILLPCHRIVRKDGGMGGFAYGISWKKNLLKHEGVQL